MSREIRNPMEEAESFANKLRIIYSDEEKTAQKAKAGKTLAFTLMCDNTILLSPESLHSLEMDMVGVNPEEVMTEGSYLYKDNYISVLYMTKMADILNITQNNIQFYKDAIKGKIKTSINTKINET